MGYMAKVQTRWLKNSNNEIISVARPTVHGKGKQIMYVYFCDLVVSEHPSYMYYA